MKKLLEKNRLEFSITLDEWFKKALSYPGIKLLDMNVEIILKVYEIHKRFHKDPADQIITATAIIHDLPVLTLDKRIMNFPQVKTIKL